jgi:serine/threonine protein kinase
MSFPPGPGRRIGRFTLGKLIGSGGVGTVYEATDDRGRVVALKLIHIYSNPIAANTITERAFAEMRVLQRIFENGASSPDIRHIAYVYDMFETSQYAVIVMERYGESLADRLRRGPLTVRSSLAKGVQIMRALRLAHRLDIVHRDVKAQNVLYANKEGWVVLADFGIARVHGDRHLTRTGKLIGTLPIMAPEQFMEGSAVVDARSDLYAFGCLLYEMLAGRQAFEGIDVYGFRDAHMQGPPVNMDYILSDVPEEVVNIIRTLLQSDSYARYGSARAVKVALTQALVNLGDPRDQKFAVVDEKLCPSCRGTGWREGYDCPICDGSGAVSL